MYVLLTNVVNSRLFATLAVRNKKLYFNLQREREDGRWGERENRQPGSQRAHEQSPPPTEILAGPPTSLQRDLPVLGSNCNDDKTKSIKRSSIKIIPGELQQTRYRVDLPPAAGPRPGPLPRLLFPGPGRQS